MATRTREARGRQETPDGGRDRVRRWGWRRTRSEEGKLNEAFAALSAAAALEAKPVTVLLLGRYRFNEPDMPGLRRLFPRLKIDFKTIRASKGLEADHVVLLNADSGRMGFPSEIVDVGWGSDEQCQRPTACKGETRPHVA